MLMMTPTVCGCQQSESVLLKKPAEKEKGTPLKLECPYLCSLLRLDLWLAAQLCGRSHSVSPLSPRAIIVFNDRETKQILEHKPCVA